MPKVLQRPHDGFRFISKLDRTVTATARNRSEARDALLNGKFFQPPRNWEVEKFEDGERTKRWESGRDFILQGP